MISLDCMTLIDQYTTYPSQADLARHFAGSPSIKRKPSPVKTIGSFYYRLYNGGVEHVLSRLISLWVAAGYRVVLFTDKPASPDDYPLPANVTRYLLPDTFSLTPETRKLRFSALQNAIQSEHIDAFVHHAFLSHNLLWDLLAVKTLGVPFIEYIHGAFYCQLPSGDPAEMDQLYILTSILKLADKIISNSNTYNLFWHDFNPNTEVFLNPCDPPKEITTAKSSVPLLLWVGRIAPEKQPEEAVKILAEVRKSVPEVRMKMLGGVDPEYQPYLDSLKACIASLGQEDAVSLEGFQPDPAPYYQEATLLLVTSSGEGFGLAIAEAQTYGLPCVAYELPCNYFAEKKECFFMAPMNDPIAAAQKILGLLEDPVALARAENEAKKNAAAFSAAAVSSHWVRLFDSFAPSDAPDTPVPAIPGITDVVSTLLSNTHIGLEKLKTQQDIWRKDAAGGFLSSVFDADYYAAAWSDLNALAGSDVSLLRHFLSKGMREGRQACESFDPKAYRDLYPDLKLAFGKDLTMYYLHFILHGRSEGRRGK